LFEGNKKLKLVLPCDYGKGSNDLILKEYLCYRLYEHITPYSFKTRLVNIELTEQREKKNRNFSIKGILIEVAKSFIKNLILFHCLMILISPVWWMHPMR